MSGFDQAMLHHVRYAAQTRLDERALRGMYNPRAAIEHELEQLAIRLTASVLAEMLPPATVERDWAVSWPFPSSPWQHWKRKHGGSWWLRRFVRRWPVKVEPHERTMHLEVDIARYRTFPESRLALPDADLGRPVLYSRTDAQWGTP